MKKILITLFLLFGLTTTANAGLIDYVKNWLSPATGGFSSGFSGGSASFFQIDGDDVSFIDSAYNFTTKQMTVSDLISCDTIDTDANGLLSCGTDASGAGGTGSNWQYETNFGADALTASSSIPVWFKDAVYASSTIKADGSITTDTAFYGDYWKSATNNSMAIQPTGDTDDFFSFKTPAHRPTIKREGGKFIYLESSNVYDVGISARADDTYSGTLNYEKDNHMMTMLGKNSPLGFKANSDYDDYIKIQTTSNIPEITVASSSALKINAGGTNSLLLNHSGGNVGVGTTSPYKLLSVAGAGHFDGAITADGNITGANLNISNWDTAHGWGDHSGVYDILGQATSTITDHTTTYNHANYDTAYGWSNHADAGYNLQAFASSTYAIAGGAFHDGFSDFVANEHLDWTGDLGAVNIHSGNYTDTNTNANTVCSGGTTYMDGDGNCDDISSVYQGLDAQLTDLADGTLTGNFINTANPWADNEVSDTLTVTGYMQDGDINTFSELQSWVSDETLLKAGTLTDTKYCIYDSASTDIICNSEGGAGGSSEWTDAGLFLYPTETSDVVVIGGNATTTTGSILEVQGRISQTGLGNSTVLGSDAGKNDDLSNNYNTFIGYQTGDTTTSGQRNTSVGASSFGFNTTGSYNTSLGYHALANRSGSNNTAVGYGALYSPQNYDGCIGLGYYAGAHDLSSNVFYVNNQDRTNALGDKEKSILYGVMNASALSQNLTANANFLVGTTTPSAKFNVWSDIDFLSFSDTASSTKFFIDKTGAVKTGIWNGTAITDTYLDGITLASGSLTLAGADALTITTTAATGITLPTSGTIYGTASDTISSANLLGSLSDETGTGAVVFGTSPTFTTGITVPANSISHTELSEGDAFVFTGSVALPQGTPTIDGAGEIGIDTTSDQLVYYGGAKRVIPYYHEKCFTIEDIADTDDNIPIWSPNKAITITDVYCRTQGGTSAVITLSDGTNALEAITCDADGQADDGSITNGAFTANERMEFDTGTVTGAVDWTNVCWTYTITAD